MAGFYSDVPGNRFAYHEDGTIVLTKDGSNNLYDVTTSAVNINDEEFSNGINMNGRNSLIFFFPELRDIQGYYVATNTSGSYPYGSVTPSSLEVSTNTTNGLDGTWTVIANPWIRVNNSTVPQYRQNINAASASLIKAIRFNFSAPQADNDIRTLHIYGSVPVTQNPNRLIFWEPVNNNPAPGPYFDWGDIPRSTAQTKQFRIRNNSSTLTANSITVSSSAVTYTMALEFSTDNITFASSVNIGALAPATTSGILYVRRTVPATETLRVQAIRLSAIAASWA